MWKLGLLLLVTMPAFGRDEVEVPNVVVAEVGSVAVFRCSSPNAVNVTWLINGTILNSLQLSDVIDSFDPISRQGAVRFRNVPVTFNNTAVQCIVHTITDMIRAPVSTLLLQGILSAVGNLGVYNINGSTVFLNWTAPFSLNITFSPVGVTYCVNVVSSTSSATLHSECGIKETEFTYLLPPRSWCHEYNFTVTPVNVVGNGAKVSMLFFQNIPGSHLMEVSIGSSNISLSMSAPLCEVNLIVEDLHTGEYYSLRQPEVIIVGTNISFTLDLLTLNRLYSLTVLAYNNIGGKAMSEGKISTHDIISCTTTKESDSISITVEFTEHSEATGALLNFIFINDNGVIDFSKSIYLSADKTNVSQGLVLPMDMWYSGQYMIYAYDIESNKKIMNGIQYEASKGNLTVINGQAGSTSPTSSTNCNVDSHARVITVACSFYFQITAQLNASDSVNILHVNTSMDPQTPVTLQVTKNGEYLVTILPVQDGRGIMSSGMQTQIITMNDTVTTQNLFPTISSSSDMTGIVGIVLGLFVVLCLTVMVILVIVVILKAAYCHKALSENVYVVYRSDSITLHMSRSAPSTTTTSEIPTHNVPTEPAPSYDSVILPAPASYQKTSAPIAIPVYSNVNLSLQRASGSVESMSTPQSQEASAFSSELTSAMPLSSGSLHPTPLVGQSGCSAGDHYVVLDHPMTAASSDVINVHHTSSEYAIPAGYKNEQNQTYVLMDLKEDRDKQHELELTNDVEKIVYAELAPQTQECGSRGRMIEDIEDERMMDEDDVVPLLDTSHS